MIEKMILTSKVVLCRKFRWISRKHSGDVERQVEAPSKMISFVTRHNFQVASEVILVALTAKQADAAIDVF